MAMLMLTGDLSGTDWPEWEFGSYPAQDPELWRRISPITYAANIRTGVRLHRGFAPRCRELLRRGTGFLRNAVPAGRQARSRQRGRRQAPDAASRAAQAPRCLT